ncbi:endonuclease/exonuclease/phosphatase family protein [Actinoallomurus sp. NBC_01490]|uniref:endonuclease/exonuclease/phosphatase family protein n=1 Tax=Actinoallomurus sp. NBC_01490 TaxID=2903557 RepID=UPI002E352EAF|nr:endonuclease/exonuclease/phosphatase family protein [Actinoallomurus sp. NBC_01490]
MTYDIAEPYGPLITTTLRLVTWNVWARFGPWESRETAIKATLARHDPDVVALVEAWDGQAERLGMPHHVFAGEGLAVLSRWPIERHEWRRLPGPEGAGGGVVFTEIAGPRGPVQLFTVALTWRLEHGAVRQEQVRALSAFVAELQRRSRPTIVCGDFNADPDSDEIRMLTGKAATAVPDLVCYDAWDTAGTGGPGHTWARANPWAAPVLWPDRRIDHILSAWPRRGGAGHPVHCEVIGADPVDDVVPSDHYGVLADLRY